MIRSDASTLAEEPSEIARVEYSVENTRYGSKKLRMRRHRHEDFQKGWSPSLVRHTSRSTVRADGGRSLSSFLNGCQLQQYNAPRTNGVLITRVLLYAQSPKSNDKSYLGTTVVVILSYVDDLLTKRLLPVTVLGAVHRSVGAVWAVTVTMPMSRGAFAMLATVMRDGHGDMRNMGMVGSMRAMGEVRRMVVWRVRGMGDMAVMLVVMAGAASSTRRSSI